MNKIFKVILNNAKHCYVVASELAKSYSKGGGSRSMRRAAVALGVAFAVYTAAGNAIAANGGGDLDLNTGDYTGNSQSNYTVTIDSDVSGEVYGHKEDSENVEEASVTMTSGTVNGEVFGGYSRLGKAASNSVSISGGTVNYNVYGGYVEHGSGNATSNSVNISDVTVTGYVFGGFSDRGNVASNSVKISDGTVIDSVYGGYVELGSGNAASNSVNISCGTVNHHVFGGRSYSGNAASNSVSISGDTTNILGNIYGGVASSTGNAYENKVNISSGTVNGEVFGGYSRLGKAASNSVSISGGTVEKAVYGGYVYSGSGIVSDKVSSNSVTISGDLDSTIIKGFVYGGYIGNGTGNVSSNSVNIVGGKVEKDVYGGYSDEDAAASNSVNISGGKVEKDVYGGWSYSNAATCNSVNISNGTIGNNNDDGNVYGGYANSGIKNANSNSINFSGGLVNNLYGGYSKQGNAASNSIIISVGTVNNNVYGGYVESGSGDAASNSVNISGGTIGYVDYTGRIYGGNVYGGYSSSGIAASNSVNISNNGKVNHNVYGGYSNSGASASNSVNISGGTVNYDVFGGYVDTGSGNAASNSVIISGGTVGVVYGGYIEEGTGVAESNTVKINGGTVEQNVFGGLSYLGDAASNSVNIISGTIGNINYGNVYGGYSVFSKAASNSVTINGGTVKQNVFGGFSSTDDTASNSVNISGDTTNILGNIYGGVASHTGNAYENKVNIATGTLKIVYGGYSESGSVASNSVDISGELTKIDEVYGGYVKSGTGSASYNLVTISGGTVNQNVYGGWFDLGSSASNSVNISGGTVNSKIFGGFSRRSNAISNSVNISGDTTNILDNIYGGVASHTGYANYNKVNIATGTLKIVYGGYSQAGNTASNSVSISGDLTKINEVYGGYVKSGTGSASYNLVTISGGTIEQNVFGGWSKKGDAASNSVSISGDSTSIVNSIYGGYVYGDNGKAVNNTVSISGGTVKQNVYGGYAKEDSGNANSNSVNIIGGTIGYVENSHVYGGNVYGGWSFQKTAASNSVTISGNTTSITDSVYGGYVESGCGDAVSYAASNSVNISGGTVGGNVYGGHVKLGQGNAASNSVYISGDFTSITGFVCGGAGGAESSAVDNYVSISGGTIEQNVFGGSKGANQLDVAGNSVNISGDKTKVNCNVYGGYGYEGSGNAASNSVNISGGTVRGNVYGGCMEKSTGANTIGNLVNISGGTIEHNVFGGYVTEGSGNSASNSVNIGGDTTKILGNIYGGVASYTGYANYNQVNISTGSIKIVYGGYSYQGNVTGNSVTISGGTFDSESKIYAGYVSYSNNSSIKDNSVNLSGTVTNLDNAEIYGYYFGNTTGTHSGNELHIGGTKTIDGEGNSVVTSGTAWQGKTGEGSINNKVKTIANFETIALHSLTWNETLPALAAESFKYDNSTVLGGNVTLDITNLTFDDDSLSGTMTLLQSNETDNFNGIKLKYSDSAATAIPDEGQIVKNETAKSSTKGIEFTYDTKHSLSLSDSNKKINYTIANGYKKAELGSMKWSDGGHTFSDNDSIYPNGLEVSIGADFNVDGSETQEDDTQLTLLDLSQTTGIIKESVDTTKRVDVQKNAASEMTFNIAREDSIKSDQNKKKVVYTVGKSKDVTNVIFNSSINWNSDTAYYSNTSFDFTNNKVIDASKLEFKFSNDQLAELSDSSVMTLVSNASNQPEGAEVAYKNDATSHSQGIDYITDNGAVLSGSMSGVINTSDSAVKFDVSQTSLDSISLTEWDGAKEASALLEGWSANTDGVKITAASFDPTVIDAEKTILTASTNVFKDENIDETIRYKNGSINNNLENGVKLSGYQTGGVKATDEGKALTYFAMEKTINKFDLADWDGEKDTKVSSTWKIADGASVETDGMKNLPESDSEKQILILKGDKEGFFANVALNGENLYGKKLNKFTDSDEAERVVLTGTQERGVAFDSAKTNLVYKFGSKDVTSLKLNTIAWEDGAEILSRDKYNYSKLTSLDTKDFNITYEKPETVAANQSMTLLKANETLADMAALEKSVTYQYEPLSGVTMDAVIRSRLEAKSGEVKLTTVTNKADKLTFGNIEWLDKGSLIDYKSMLNNISFNGADVDTTKIAFTNKQKLDADMQMTLVSDFGDSVGTITGSKYKVGTAYEGEGSAYLEGSDLVFKTKTGAGLSDETHTTVMAMEAGMATIAEGSNYVNGVMDGLGMADNAGSDGLSTAASFGGGASRYETGSHVDTNSWNIAVAVGKNLEKRDGTMEYGLFAEYGRGNYTLHMNGVEDAGSGNTHYSGGGLLLKWTNSHDVYTEASFRMGSMKDNASSLLHDGNGIAYGYDTSAKYRGGHFGIGKICREEGGTKLEIYGKYFYNQREGINFAAGADQYSLDEVRSRVMRAGFRYSTTQRKWNRYGGLAFDHEFGGESRGTVNGNAIRSASVKGGTLRGEFGYCREATKTNPWKTDISLYGFTGKRNGFGGSVAVEYQFW